MRMFTSSEVCKVQPNYKTEIRIPMTANSLASFQTLFRDKKMSGNLCEFEIDANIVDGRLLERET